MIVAAHTERIEAQRLLALAGDGNHDRGPLDAVRLPAQPVGVEHYLQVRAGIDLVPSAAVLGHGRLHRLWLWLWLFRHCSRLLSPDGYVRRVVRARSPGVRTLAT